MKKTQKKITITKNGPYVVSGNLPLSKETIIVDKKNYPEKWEKGKKYPNQDSYRLCRCGGSCNKPFCDGTHIKIGFDGTETASRKKYIENAEKTEGDGVDLTDNFELCALARFCEKDGGVWDLTENSNNPESKKMAIQEACNCPSGRLVVWDKKTKKPIEPKFEKSLSLVEDPSKNCSGPIWAKGGIPIESSDGKDYETRNRVTLCRCGKSCNKPFCDGTHIKIGFKA